MSACLPGLGQIYNKKYWKLPLVYGGLGALTYMVIDNNRKYQDFKIAYQYRTDNIESTVDNYPERTEDQLQKAREVYRSNLELSVILTAGVYIINIIDASVDAHLYDFNISDDLSMRITPNFLTDNRQLYSGLTLKMTF